MSNILLWLDSIVETDEPGKESICKFLFDARQWFVTHNGHMEGFAFSAQGEPWWKVINPPFKCKAKPGCRLWRIPLSQNITQDLATTAPLERLTDNRIMDVFHVWMPGGQYPGWFVVFETATARLVCLADECDGIK